MGLEPTTTGFDSEFESQMRHKSRNEKSLCFYMLLISLEFFGVTDGARTHDNRNHNPGLYQLSYGHHCMRSRQLPEDS